MQGEKLSYSRLVTRTKYFQEKSLELEKELIFAHDQVSALKGKLSSMEESDKERIHLKKELEQLQEDIERKTKENVAKIVEIEKRSAVQESTKSYLNKIKGYETLLAEMQIDINEKDKLINHLQGKIKNLEKRAKFLTKPNEVDGDTESTDVDESYAVAYFNTSVILNGENSFIIRGSLQIENCGTRKLHNPIICFRFNPPNVAVLKGKIFPIDEAETRSKSNSEQTQWVFTEHDWLEKAKESGEIWVAPLHPVTLLPGEQIGFDSFQIPIKSEFKESINIEGFVYFQQDNYRIKVSNQIAVSY